MKLTDAVIGLRVIYTPYGYYENKKLEYGVISSYNNRYIFVKFRENATNGTACDPMDLDYE